MKTLKKFLFLLNNQERKHACLLLLMILIMALLDMVGVASILPFMTVLTNPELVETNFILNTMYIVSFKFGVENNHQFLFALGVLVFLLLIIALIFKSLTTYVQLRFIQMREFSVSKRLVEEYLHQPYSWFLSRNSSELGKTILSEVQQVVLNGLSPLLELIAKSVVTLTLIILLIIVDPKLTIIVGLSLGGAYSLIFYFVRHYVNIIGNKRLENNQLRFLAVGEAFGAIKEVKVASLEKIYTKQFSESAIKYAQTQASAQAISQLPRFILEAIAFGGILLIILYIMSQTGNFNSALPVVALYVFAGYRLMPALQQIYSSFTQLTFIGPSLNKLYNDLQNLKPLYIGKNLDFTFKKKILLKNIYYDYPNSSRTALKNINITIPAKSTIGLVGATGSGKTTTVDIILGLLEAKKGTLEVDGNVITKKNARSWQQLIGYVPQNIYLADDTIASNIAFGVDIKDINNDMLEKASKISNLHDFIIEELPSKYQTRIGERGVRLSGGQRQRIGIARALYNSPKVLILDEATSSLDNQTEKAVMDAVNNISKNTTIILIAHRLNTVKNCDIIFELSKGELIAQGSFDELINSKNNFSPN